MKTLCPNCPQTLTEKDWDTHQFKMHPEHYQQMIEMRAFAAVGGTTTKEVDWLYRKFKMQLINGEGWLLEKALRWFPYRGAKAEYNANTGMCRLEAPIADYAAVLKHVNTISRLGRAWRHENWKLIAEWRSQPVDAKQMERAIEESWSRRFWYGASHEQKLP